MSRPRLTPVVDARSGADRFLGLFAPVRAGEARLALVLALDVFLILTAYYTLKVVREPLILAGGGAFGLAGAELKAAAAGAQALLLVGLIPAYGALAARLPRLALLDAVSGFFLVTLLAFAALHAAGASVGVPFFVWLGIFNLMAVAQVWSFATELYSPEDGKRLFAIVAAGGTAGAVAGSALGGALIVRFPPAVPMLAAALLLGLAIAVTHLASRLAPRRAPAPAPAPSTTRGGFGLVLRSRYLGLIALLVLVYNVVNTNGEFVLGRTVVEEAARAAAALFPDDAAARAAHERQRIGAFYGGFFAAVNVATWLLQLLVVSRLGPRAALLVMPLITLGGTTLTLAMGAIPLLSILRGAKIAENAADYSIQNTARQALFLPVTPDEKYQAKAAIDTFFVRAGDVLSFGVIVAVNAAGLGVRAVAAVNLVLVAAWIGLALAIRQRHPSRARPALSGGSAGALFAPERPKTGPQGARGVDDSELAP
jgi:AAA family ATP:ADP antiporter